MRLLNKLLSAACALTLVAGAASAQTVIKAGHGAQAGHPSHFGLLKFAEIVAAKSGGKMKVEVYPDRQLGEEREMIEGLQLGTVDMAVVSTGPLLAFAPKAGVLDLPFLFKNSAHAYKVLDGDVGKSLLKDMEARNIIGVAWWENGWRHLTTKKEIKSPNDLKGIKLRTMQNPVHIAAFQKLGASPVPMAWGEVFTSLSQGVIDAQENPVTVIYTNSLWEVQKYLTLTGHVYGPHVVLVSGATWGKLTADQKTWVRDAIVEATGFQRQTSQRLEKEQLEALKQKGMIVNTIDVVPFQTATAEVASTAKAVDQEQLKAIRAAGN
jgi:tripartite ATP-independent transporter DctP family solute receptor